MNIRFELPEILMVCATFLCIQQNPVMSYILFALGLLIAALRTGLNHQNVLDEKKRKDKYESELKLLLIKNSIPKTPPDSNPGSDGYHH